jgi:predicted CXXCH cytochrome family protein
MDRVMKKYDPAAAILLFMVISAAFPSDILGRTVIDGTAHQFEYGSVEPENWCGSACHTYLEGDVSLSEVELTWMSPLNNVGTIGSVAPMCADCHRSDGAYSSVMYDAFSDDNVYHSESHGQKMSLNNLPPGTSPGTSGLPDIKVSPGNFECSTCHNAHDDSMRPFLRESINGLCARCHGRRQYVQGSETTGAVVIPDSWNPAAFGGLNNPGSHPVGPDIMPGRSGAPMTVIDAIFKVSQASTSKAWSLGPHLSEGSQGGVVCVTCHTVHGTDPDSDDETVTAVQASPFPVFLAVAQSEGSIRGYSRVVPNGHGSHNPLCESCHGVENNPTSAPGSSSWADDGLNVNPGDPDTFSHPIDSYPSALEGLAIPPPENWPTGNPRLRGSNVSYTLICETCHQPHPAAALASDRSDVFPGAGAYILRAPIQRGLGSEVLCDICHIDPIEAHHPIMKPFDGLGVGYLINAAQGPGNVLSCATCHNEAHNWTQPGRVGMDPSWKPTDNGRQLVQAMDMYNLDMSKTCMDCHYFMDGDGISVSPTMGSMQTVISDSDPEFQHFQALDNSMGTHYIGVIHEDEAVKWRGEPLLDIFETSKTWLEQSPDPDLDAGLADGWSRFGGVDSDGNRVLVCESCHELEPDKNAGFSHLLLAPFMEGKNGIEEYPGDDDGRDILCVVCHGKPTGSHPMTGDIVSRSGNPLDPAVDWVRDSIEGNATLDRDYDAMSCDSCHQPHDANSISYTYCLDVPETLSIPGYSGRGIGDGKMMPGYSELTSGTVYFREADGNPEGYTTPKSGPVAHHGLCLQCHAK